MTAPNTGASLKECGDFFRAGTNMTLKQFADEWKQLTPEDKVDIKTGLGDGSLNY